MRDTLATNLEQLGHDAQRRGEVEAESLFLATAEQVRRPDTPLLALAERVQVRERYAKPQERAACGEVLALLSEHSPQ